MSYHPKTPQKSVYATFIHFYAQRDLTSKLSPRGTGLFFLLAKRTLQFLTQQDLSRSQLGNKLLWIVRMIWNRLNALFLAMVNRTPPYCHYISKNRPKKGHKRPNSPSGAALLSGLGGSKSKSVNLLPPLGRFLVNHLTDFDFNPLKPCKKFCHIGEGEASPSEKTQKKIERFFLYGLLGLACVFYTTLI
jgi:hypothetical protein